MLKGASDNPTFDFSEEGNQTKQAEPVKALSLNADGAGSPTIGPDVLRFARDTQRGDKAASASRQRIHAIPRLTILAREAMEACRTR
ncbi:hypothetical protein N0B51_00770 [Tsuneonella sp. YG55]|uniref:Uncharacterized protein n=1 Tax=Tsuneonella litorea TaxID=2976475 RepID=A0A9X2VZ36_9SPHN|nr:hypothetical protein [Tsuneonella litorea]MCT2557504.1 hypothetical protein [Tsuneonella litorea]